MSTLTPEQQASQEADHLLVEQFFAGDELSFEQIVSRYENKVFNTALALTEDTSDAEEVLKTVFTSLHEKLSADFGKTPLFSWLIQHTLDTSVSKLIERKSDQIELPAHHREKSNLHEHVLAFHERNPDLRGALLEAAKGLPQYLKLVFLLRDIQGLTLGKTAAILGLNVFETRSRIHLARLQIRERLLVTLDALSRDLPVEEAIPQHGA